MHDHGHARTLSRDGTKSLPRMHTHGDARMLKSPYPWFGGKARVAPLVWQRFGDVRNYIEPFFGGGAVLLGAPWSANRTETVNDINAWLCNFWRAVKHDPDGVAQYASDPVSELDLHARGAWLFYRDRVDQEFVERLRGNPDWYCVRSAGWWVWGQSSWIGDNWGRRDCRSRPHLGAGIGVNRQRPHLGDAGKDAGTPREAGIRMYMRQLCERVVWVRVCCGDWTRVLGPTPTHTLGLTAVFFDPPYAVAHRDTVYGEHDSRDVARDVRERYIANGNNPLLRIALCGYEDEHDMPATWDCVSWKAHGGYSVQRQRGDNGNRHSERIWFSPHCLGPEDRQGVLPWKQVRDTE